MSTMKLGCGCGVPTIISLIILWALIFGVTWDGKHHGIACNHEEGVIIR